jgi:hypothetical protein
MCVNGHDQFDDRMKSRKKSFGGKWKIVNGDGWVEIGYGFGNA